MRFSGDLLTPGLAVVEATAPDEEHRAWTGVIIAETTVADGQRAWTVLAHDGRFRSLTDAEVHWCRRDGCPLCPRPDRPALRRALGRELTEASRRTGPWTWADTERVLRIRTLLSTLRSA